MKEAFFAELCEGASCGERAWGVKTAACDTIKAMETIKKKTSQLQSPQGRMLIAIIVITAAFYIWQVYTTTSGPERFPISYSQFMEELNASNIKSVSRNCG
jgi:hypothetical protein